ncbi:MAG: hypothetical protein IH991_15750 [Planctomycetes bacterium]|nr:hypothetical protein [Planctomycetota bacterium]
MKSFPKIRYAALLWLVACWWALPVEAQRRAPKRHAVVFAVASLDEQFADLLYLAQVAAVPEAALFVPFLKAEFAKGIDMTKPIGAYMHPTEKKPHEFVWFIPVTNFDGLLNVFGQGRQKEDVGNGVFKISPVVVDGQFAKVERGYAFFSNNIKRLAALPMAPAAELGGLDKTYNFAAQFNMQKLSVKDKTEFVESLTEGFGDAVNLLDNIHRGADDLVKQFGTGILGTATRLIHETDLILLGLAVDSERKRVYLDFDVTGTKGSQLTRQLERLREAKSKFAGFIFDDALLNFNFIETIPKADVELYKTTLAAIRAQLSKGLLNNVNNDQRAAVEELLKTVFASLDKTAEGGKFDAGGAVVLSPKNRLTAVVGVSVQDTAGLEDALKKAVLGLFRANEDRPALKLNSATHRNIRFHTLTIPLPNDDLTQKLFGKQTDLVVGFGNEAVYLAIGEAGLTTLKRAIDQSAGLVNKVVPAVRVQVSVGSLLKLTAMMNNLPELEKLVDGEIAGGHRDKVSLTTKSIPRGMTARIQVDEGVIRIIGRAARQGFPAADAGIE